ncbi:MAG TPA: hypothetical protein VLL52_04650 [Anaerolineae bacterium]|nr:hypothetical protein [Anaerolineae bacterium]
MATQTEINQYIQTENLCAQPADQAGIALRDQFPDITVEQFVTGFQDTCNWDARTINVALAAVEWHTPHLMRDNMDDHGLNPSTGTLYRSPDIIPQQQNYSTAEAETRFGGSNWNKAYYNNIEYGQDNYIYLRVQNLSTLPERATLRVHLFWSRTSSFPNPSEWNPINPQTDGNGNTYTTTVTGLGPEEKRVLGPIVWAKDDIPEEGHYCLIGYVESDQDLFDRPEDYFTPDSTSEDFRFWVQDNDNVAWRNINVVDYQPNVSGFAAPQPTYTFFMEGLPHSQDTHALEMATDLPSGSQLRITYGQEEHNLKAPGNNNPITIADNINLGPKQKLEVAVYVTMPPKAQPGMYLTGFAQKQAGNELGGVSFLLRVS